MKKFLVTLVLGIMVLSLNGMTAFADEVAAEKETTFDYSKMDKDYRYKEEWKDYYDIGFCSNVSATKSSYSYTGKEIKPEINVLVHDTKSSKVNKKLDKKYYIVTFQNNVVPGKATAIVKGINGFYGEKKITFNIKIATPKIKSVKVKGKKITVKTDKNSAVTKYQIRYKKCTEKKAVKFIGKNAKGIDIMPGKWKIVSSNKNTVKTKKLKKGNYFVQLKTYIKINGKKYYSDWKVYNALVNVKTKKANKKNFKFKNYISPNKFNEILNKKYYGKGMYNYTCLYDHIDPEGVNCCNWAIYYNGKLKYCVNADKYGNIISKY